MIKDNIIKIKRQIEAVCAKVKCAPDQITIVAVSKGRILEQIKQAVEAGLINIGENKVQEALIKHNELMTYDLGPRTITWHMVGHLQTNKVKDAVKIFDLIHSVDSVHLAEEINKQAAKINKTQDILIEVNTSGETAKYGFKPDEVMNAVEQVSELKNVNIKGLMTVAPITDNPEKNRPYFKLLRELRDRIIKSPHSPPFFKGGKQGGILSMGMTDDFEVAIEEGANMIRLGRAIFNEISPHSPPFYKAPTLRRGKGGKEGGIFR